MVAENPVSKTKLPPIRESRANSLMVEEAKAFVSVKGAKAVDEVAVFSVPDGGFATPGVEPTQTMTGSQYVVSAFEVQYRSGTSWVTVQGGAAAGNDRVWRRLTFPEVVTRKVRVRVRVTGVAGDDRSSVAELEAWGPAEGAAEVRWLVADQLGTPRMIVDGTGSLAGIKRQDYLPFGEELSAGAGGRTSSQGYGAADHVRQKFTGYERDGETTLDYAQARYYSSSQGRFTGVDPLLASGVTANPQTWNRYAYTLNNPLRLIDPSGLNPQDPQQQAPTCDGTSTTPCTPTDVVADDTPIAEEVGIIATTVMVLPRLMPALTLPGISAAAPVVLIAGGGAGAGLIFWSTTPNMELPPSLPSTATNTATMPAGPVVVGNNGLAPPLVPSGRRLSPLIYNRREQRLIQHIADRFGLDYETLSDELHSWKESMGMRGKAVDKQFIEDVARALTGQAPTQEGHDKDKR